MDGQMDTQAEHIRLSYRRGDVEDTAGRIYDRLVARYGRERITRIVFDEADAPSTDAELDGMRLWLVVIGPRWLAGISHPNDPERRALAVALNRQTPLIPILAEGTAMPDRTQMPEELGLFALFNAAQARPDPDFDADMRRLLASIERSMPGLVVLPHSGPVYVAQASTVSVPQQRRIGCSLWGVLAGIIMTPAILFLLVAILITLAGSTASPKALAATPPATATFFPTPSAAGSYYSPLTDGMPDWETSQQCQPQSDGLHIANSDNGCQAPDAAAAGDGDLSVTARQISGDTNLPYGLYLRSPIIGGQFYAFLVTSSGEWSMQKDISGTAAYVIPWRAAVAIHTGVGATNTLEVRFKGAQFTFLVNGTQVGAVTDASIPANGTASDPEFNDYNGLFGHTGIEVVFTNYRLKPVG